MCRPVIRRLLFVGCVVVCGCSQRDSVDYNRVELVDVTGTVTLDGQPLAKAVVTFEDQEKRTSIGQTDEQGAYRLKFDNARFGCIPGRKIVRISTARSMEEGADPEGSTDADTPKVTDRVPPQYNTKSELNAEVSEVNNQFDFALRSSE